MAYENLKNSIKQAIKQNGNQEITGNILQNTLLSITDEFIQRDDRKYIFIAYINTDDTLSSLIDYTNSADVTKPLFITHQDGEYLNVFLSTDKVETINGVDKNTLDSLFLKGPHYVFSDNNYKNITITKVIETKDNVSYIDNTCQLLEMPLKFIINTFDKTLRIESLDAGTESLNLSFHFLEHTFDRPHVYRLKYILPSLIGRVSSFETDSIPEKNYYWHLIGIYDNTGNYDFKVVGPYSKYLNERNYFILATWFEGQDIEDNMIVINQSPFIDVRENIYFTYVYNKTRFEFPMLKSERIDYAESLYLSAIMKSFLVSSPGNIKIHYENIGTNIIRADGSLNPELATRFYITVGDTATKYLIPFYPTKTYSSSDPLRNRTFDSYVNVKSISNSKKVTISFPKSLDPNSVFDDNDEDLALINGSALLGIAGQYWIFCYDLILQDYFLFCYAYIPKIFFEHLRLHRIILFGCGELSSKNTHLFNMFTAYDYDEDSIEKKHYKSFSVLGDSYSTFKDYMTQSEAALWYPAIPNSGTEGANSGNGLSDVQQTWWAIFAKKTGIPLEENNSWSGACICYDSYGAGIVDGKEKSFLNRCQNVGKPGLYLIFGGTNDSWAGVGMGDYKYANWTENDYSYYRPALAKMFDTIQNKYLGATIVFILNNDLSSDINESTKTICEHYGIKILNLQNISKIGRHPDSAGMKQIADQLIKFLNLD